MKKVLFSLFLFIIFLYSVFGENSQSEKKSNDNLGFSAQLAISNSDYMVTVGDFYRLTYSISGNMISYEILVDSTYDIRIGNLGVIKAKGKSYISLKKEVEELVLRNFPMSGVQFVLVSPSVFTVKITGEVNSATEKKVWGLTRVSEAISNSLTEYSSSRNIKIKSENGKEKVVDLFKARRDGDLSNDPYVRPGDEIIVQRMDRKVTIVGEVERPGTYELLPGENLKELVEKYGNGLTEFADLSRIEVFRVKSENSVSGQMMYLNAQDLEDEVLTTFDVQCYDSVTVMSFKNLKPVVFIEGAVLSDTNKSGTELLSSNKLSINFEIDTNYAFFVRSNRKIFTSVSDLKNAYIKRGQDTIPIDLEKILYDKSYYSELIVENGDTLLVPFRQFFVTVSGAVNNPGRYPYIPDRTYEYYVGLAGGFIKSQNSGDAVRLTDVNGKHFSKKTVVPPEAMIEAKTNSFLYYFNQVGGVVTTLVSIVLSSLTLLVTLGVF